MKTTEGLLKVHSSIEVNGSSIPVITMIYTDLISIYIPYKYFNPYPANSESD